MLERKALPGLHRGMTGGIQTTAPTQESGIPGGRACTGTGTKALLAIPVSSPASTPGLDSGSGAPRVMTYSTGHALAFLGKIFLGREARQRIMACFMYPMETLQDQS